MRSRKAGSKTRFTLPVIQNFTYQGKTYGLPTDVAPIVFWYNKELVKKAGVDPTKIKDWDDFIEAVKKCQAAGITPLAAGGKDKWPLHFYPAMLMMRILGKEGMQAAYDGKNGGFAESRSHQSLSALQRSGGAEAVPERLSWQIPMGNRPARFTMARRPFT